MEDSKVEILIWKRAREGVRIRVRIRIRTRVRIRYRVRVRIGYRYRVRIRLASVLVNDSKIDILAWKRVGERERREGGEREKSNQFSIPTQTYPRH
jgi:hypothetical protein